MHELSIATSIVELAQEEAERRGGAKVCAVHLKLGLLSGVVKEALLSCYELVCEDTPLRGSRLVIEDIPIVVYCPRCKTPRPVSSIQCFCCSVCNAPAGDVVQGRELEVVALEIQE